MASSAALTAETPAEAAKRRAAEVAEARHQNRVARAKAGPAKKSGGESALERSYLGRKEHSGALKLGDMALALGIGAGSALWTATRSHSTGDDLYWAVGSTLLGGIVAVEAREGTEVEYGASAIAAANAAYLVLRLTGGITQGG